MKKSVFITGASSGIGRSSAELFAQRGWRVVAAMRTPSDHDAWAAEHGIHCVAMDVCRQDTVDEAVRQATVHGPIDVVVNNAGYGVDGVFEAMDDGVIKDQFETNVFGLMRVTRAFIPMMRARKSGTIIQVASVGGRLSFPAYSIYHGTKWAVEGFSESLQYELRSFNIRVKLIEPGAIKTAFYGRSRTFVRPANTGDYDDFLQQVEAVSMKAGAGGAAPQRVAETIWKAANDSSSRLRYPVAYPANLLLPLKRILPEKWFYAAVRLAYGLK